MTAKTGAIDPDVAAVHAPHAGVVDGGDELHRIHNTNDTTATPQGVLK